MKKLILLIFSLFSATLMQAQTLKVAIGEVTYAIPAAEAGNMLYSSGSTVTILNKTYTLSEIDSMYVDNSSVDDAAVNVTYSGSTAKVTIPGALAQYLTVATSGAHVSIMQSASLASEINYTLTGSSTAGSFYMDGDYKATLTLNNVSLTNPDSAAINIENGKRIAVDIEGTNALVDGTSGSQKACFMINGHSEFTGSGTLALTGKTKHALWGDEYVQLKKTFTGTITVVSSVKDGFSINQYFKMNNGTVIMTAPGDDGIQVETTGEATDANNGQIMINGGTLNINVAADGAKGIRCDSLMTITDDDGYHTTINITTATTAYAGKGLKSGTDMNITGGTFTITTNGKGEWDSDDKAASACAALKADRNMTISGGTFTLTATGSGGKGINADGVLTISGGTMTIKTTGGLYYNNGTTENTNYTGNTDNVSSSYTSSPKGMKVDGNVIISGGTISVKTSGYNAEGIESKAELYIKDGTVEVEAYDDAINSSSNMYIQGGKIYVSATNNDGLDANGNMYIQGGTVVAYGTTSPECGIDANEEGGYSVKITGGTLIGIGGGTSYPNSSGTTQPSIAYSGTVSSGTSIALNGSDGTNILGFTMGRSYSGSVVILMTSPSLTAGSSYTLYTGSTISGDSWHGLYAPATVSSTGTSAGTVSSLSSPYSSIGTGGGGGQPGGGPGGGPGGR